MLRRAWAALGRWLQTLLRGRTPTLPDPSPYVAPPPKQRHLTIVKGGVQE